MRWQAAVVWGLLLVSGVTLWLGCGGGGGGSGTLEGVVSDGSSGGGEVADAYVYVPSTRGGRQTNLVETFTDDNGAFVIEGLPLDQELELHVEPPEGMDAVGATVPVVVPSDLQTQVQFVSLIPSGPAASVTGITVTPSTAELRRADTLQFDATITGPTEPLRPTWWVVGNIGRITPTGLFVAVRPGTGTVAAAIGSVSAQVPVRVLPEPAPWAVLLIVSRPPGAAIYLDDLDTGSKTPWIFAHVLPGQHTVRAQLPDLLPGTQEVYLRAGDVAAVPFWLLPSGPTGQIYVASTPPGAAALLDGRTTGTQTPVLLPHVAPGAHMVALLLKGYQKESRPVMVQAGATSELSVTLQPLGAAQ